MNRRQKIIISVTGIFIVMLILVGLTYAYFLTQITGNTKDKSISVTTADLRVVYGDGTKELLTSSTKLVPSSNAINTKDFTVTNTGDSTEYAVIIENVRVKVAGTNTLTNFESNDFKYTLTCTKSDGSSCNGVSTQTTLPMNDSILVTNEIDSEDTHTYVITLWYLDNGRDQSKDMNKTLEARLNIEDPNRINPYSNNTNSLAYKIINSSLNVTKEQEELGYAQYRTTPLTDMSVGISENNSGVYRYETMSTDEVEECGYVDLYRGNTYDGAYNMEESVSSYQEAIGYYVYEDCYGEVLGYLESYDSSTGILTFRNETSESTLSITEDDYGTSFYYRGGVKNNYVSFAGFTWRIVRINGDGSVRLILDGTLDKVKKDGVAVYTNAKLAALDSDGKIKFNTKFDDNAYVGYMYGNFTGNSTSYDQAHKNEVSSTIKTYIDVFYEEYLKSYESNLADTLFCGDKTLSSDYSTANSGFGKVKTNYGAYERLIGATATPTLECAKSATNTYSRYTSESSKTTKGVAVNSDLTYPIGLLSADELVMAGAYWETPNESYYLYDAYGYQTPTLASYWWTMSPYYFNGIFALEFDSNATYYSLYSNYVDYDIGGSRPVINLKADSLVSGGNGTQGSPYRIG